MSLKIPKGQTESVYRRRIEKGQKYKQRSTKHKIKPKIEKHEPPLKTKVQTTINKTYNKTKDRETRTPTKN